MSSQDFRARLYSILKESGILDTMKSQLRNKLASELHVLTKTSALGSPAESSQGKTSKCMLAQVAESVVARYLQSAGHEYTLSTFLPEVGICMDELVSEEDLLCYLRISPSSSIHTQLQTKMKNRGNFLEGLLEILIETQGGGYTALVEASSQVIPEQLGNQKSSPSKTSVAYKLEALEEVYARKVEEETLKCAASLEDRLAAIHANLEARYKRQLETKMSLYQERELAKVRREERERYHDELAKEKEELQHAYHLRLENAKKSEKNMAEIFNRKEMDLEAGIFSQRQVLLNELNALRVKDAGLKRQAELDNRAMELERERLKTMNEQLEKSLQQIKVHFELMAREKTKKQEEQVQDVATRWDKELNVSVEALSSQQKKVQRLTEELSQERKIVEAVQSQLKEVSMEKAALQRQKDNAEAKLNQVPQDNYHKLECEMAELQKKLSNSESKRNELKSIHKQQQNNIKQLQAQLSQLSLDLIASRDKLTLLQETHHKQLLVMEYDKKQFGRQLDLQVEHGLQLQKRLDKQLLQLKSAQREVEDLHTLLEHKLMHKALQGSHKGHEKESSASAHSPFKRTRPAKSSPHQKYPTAQTPLQTSSPDTTGDITTATSSKENTFNIHGSFLSESKAAISRIEKEAEELEKAYQHFHYDMTSSAMPPAQKNYNRHSNDQQHPFHHNSNPSPLQTSCFNARITPMDYIKTQHDGFIDATHRSTAPHVFSTPTCDGRAVFTTSASSMVFTNMPPKSQQPMAATSTAAEVATMTSSLPTSTTQDNTTTPALISGIANPVLISGTANTALISGTGTSALISGTATPALISGTANTALISGIANPVLISGTANTALISGTGTSALISGTATPALISGTANTALISGTGTPALISGTATPALISGTATPALISGTANTALISGTANPTLISEIAIRAPVTVLPSVSLESLWKTSNSSLENTVQLGDPVLTVAIDNEPITVTTGSVSSNDPVSTSLAHGSLDRFRKPPESSLPEVVGVMVTSQGRNQAAPVPTTTASFGFFGTASVSADMAEAAKESTLSVTVQDDDRVKETAKDELEKRGGNGEPSLIENIEHSQLNEEQQQIKKKEVLSPSNSEAVEKKTKSVEDDEMDPVMLKYMKIVEEKRKSEKQSSSQLHRKQAIDRRGFEVKKDLDVSQLSGSDSFGCGDTFDQDDNPFEGW